MNRHPKMFRVCLFAIIAGLSTVCCGQESEFIPLFPESPCQLAFSNHGHFVNDEGVRETSGGTTTVRFLRTEVLDEEDHWWLETAYKIETDGFAYGSTHRLLIPQSALMFGKSPLQQVKRGWFSHTQMTPPDPIEINVSGDWTNRPWFTRALIHFNFEPEPVSLPAETIETPAGRFHCHVWRIMERRQTEDDEREVEHTFYLSDETPAPLVGWTARTTETDAPGSFEVKFLLAQYHEEPVAKIPLDDD